MDTNQPIDHSLNQQNESTPGDCASARPAESPWLVRGIAVALLLACAIALSPNTVDPDTWGHVQYAEDALAEGTLHRTATHTFTAEDHVWINHENLSELALAIGYRLLDVRGMLVAKCLLGLLVICLMIRSARRENISLLVVCGFLLLVATALTSFWAMRPQLASYVFLALMVVVLDHAFRTWHEDYKVHYAALWTLPVLFAVWANSHGAFVAGLCLLIAYLGLRGVESLWHGGKRSIPTAGLLAALALSCALATLATPYGLDLWSWLAGSLGQPRPEISEWAAPAWNDPFFIPFVLLAVVSVASWVFTTERRDWVQGVLIALTIWQAACHARHIALFAILAGFWLPQHVESLVRRLRNPASLPASSSVPSPKAQRYLGSVLCLVLVLLFGRLTMRLYDFPVERDNYPVSALQYMADHGISGRLVVSFNWAQYAIAALAPESQVSFDGRFRTCYPQEVIDMHFDFLIGDVGRHRSRSKESGPIDGHRVLQYERPDTVLIDRRFPHSVKVMQEQTGFVLLYQDSLAQVWGRRQKYDNPQAVTYIPQQERHVAETLQEGSVTWPALPTRKVMGRIVDGKVFHSLDSSQTTEGNKS